MLLTLFAIIFFGGIILVISAITFAIGYKIGHFIKFVSELTGHEAKLYKISRWFFNFLAIGAFLLESSTPRSVKDPIPVSPRVDGLGYFLLFLMPGAIFLLCTIIRTFFVKYKEGSILQYASMGINLQIAAFISFNAIAIMV